MLDGQKLNGVGRIVTDRPDTFDLYGDLRRCCYDDMQGALTSVNPNIVKGEHVGRVGRRKA